MRLFTLESYLIKKIFFCLFLLCLVPTSYSLESKVVRHSQVQDRYSFGVKLLKLALSKVGKYDVVGPRTQALNEARLDVQVKSGRIDLQFISTTDARESEMIPIKIPVYRGLLGLRLLLVKDELEKVEKEIVDFNSLKGATAVHGLHWSDLSVFKENNLKVKAEVSYEQMFVLLKKGRVDYFHRGLAEVWGEYDQHSSELKINEHVMLFYPHPVYFFVTKKRPDLAKELEKGLKRALSDGSYKKLFLDEFGLLINNAKLSTRKLIVLKNPTLPVGSPKIDTSWWSPKQIQ